MKKTFGFALVLLLIAAFTLPVYAADETDQSVLSQDSIMKPAYTAIMSMAAGLSIDSLGKASCGGTVFPNNDTYTAYLTISLQKQTGSTWQQLTSWSSSGVGMGGVLLDGSYYVEHGTYRVCSAAFIYSAQGSLLESALYYSPIKTY
ncbi:hypothetical protein [Sporobacter termitidis]|uniref:hypothetical protein n=1 Tax=Sporobacter termitidis TaxID=44749 RepID=UPI0009344A0D|nr:hypothetical protein [Sporobacter termitidis]